MGSRELRVPPFKYARNTRGRKNLLDVDLNAAPPNENGDQEGTSTRDGHSGIQGRSSVHPPPIDVETLDDDAVANNLYCFCLLFSSLFPGLNLIPSVIIAEERHSRFAPSNRNKRRRTSANQTIINCDLYINLEGSSNSMREKVQKVASPPPPPPPKEPTFTCPICMGPLVEEMSTKCGHIFCKVCIKAAIAAQRKCPTCRRSLAPRDTIRVYLPVTN
ncbi:hypothetical protein RJ639_014557 [Escallonia herrerae]|uniref:RING-type domain-containing protein n=1 Tax=Escallonia herrerae TaxID=1293975 RepID=A0AA88VFW5_9ASTE|nr:hypothetical protein RJ639_014557 [Escallonia herrerae]